MNPKVFVYHVDYDLEDAGQDESTAEASSGWEHLQDRVALPASAGLAHAVCRNCKLTNKHYSHGEKFITWALTYKT